MHGLKAWLGLPGWHSKPSAEARHPFPWGAWASSAPAAMGRALVLQVVRRGSLEHMTSRPCATCREGTSCAHAVLDPPKHVRHAPRLSAHVQVVPLFVDLSPSDSLGEQRSRLCRFASRSRLTAWVKAARALRSQCTRRGEPRSPLLTRLRTGSWIGSCFGRRTVARVSSRPPHLVRPIAHPTAGLPAPNHLTHSGFAVWVPAHST